MIDQVGVEQPAAAPRPPWVRLADGTRRPDVQRPVTARRVVGQFVGASVAALLLLIAGGTMVGRQAAHDESIADARHSTDLLAETVIQPNLQPGLLSGDPAAFRRLDNVVRQRILGRYAVRVKLWRSDGLVLYSDETELVGRHFTLPPDEREALEDGETHAELSDHARPENQFENGKEKLLEVYRPIAGPGGQELLFETYARYDAVTARSGAIWLRFAPITFGVLLLLLLVQLPLARRMLRQLRRGQEEREILLRRAVQASDEERRRIAGSLHDGIVQDLAGASFVVAGCVDRLERGEGAKVTAPLHSASLAIRQAIGGLRSMLVEIYPPSLRSAGLTAALNDLVAPMRARNIDVRTDLPHDADLPPDAEALLFRTAQEALRNAVKHSGATTVDVRLERRPESAVLTVTDDGLGFTPATLPPVTEAGHLGLRLLVDLAEDAGARLDVSSAPGQGTTVRLEVPFR